MAIKRTYTAVLFLKKYLIGAWITKHFITSDSFTLWKYYIRKLQSNVSNLYGYANAGKNKFNWPLSNGFSKLYRPKRGWNPVFATFNITISHIFPENFIDIPQAVQKIWKIFLSVLAIFIDARQFFEFFDISLLQRT